jgi:hypothetical protein
VALEQDGTQPATTTKLIRKLERELARKERPLAEAAALLVLKKRWRERTPGEVDDNRRAERELILTAIARHSPAGFLCSCAPGSSESVYGLRRSFFPEVRFVNSPPAPRSRLSV